MRRCGHEETAAFPHRPCHLPASASSPAPYVVGVLHKTGRSDRLHMGIESGPDGRRRGEETQRLRLHSVGIAQVCPLVNKMGNSMRARLDTVSSCLSTLLVLGLTLLSQRCSSWGCRRCLCLRLGNSAELIRLGNSAIFVCTSIVTILVIAVPLGVLPFLFRLFDRWIPSLPPFVALQRTAGASAQARNLDRALTNVHSANQRERVAAVVALARSAVLPQLSLSLAR